MLTILLNKIRPGEGRIFIQITGGLIRSHAISLLRTSLRLVRKEKKEIRIDKYD
jgi:hypothetical protein